MLSLVHPMDVSEYISIVLLMMQPEKHFCEGCWIQKRGSFQATAEVLLCNKGGAAACEIT